MKQHLFAIIAALTAAILALFSIDTANNPYSNRSCRTYGYNSAPNTWDGFGEEAPSVLQKDNTGNVDAPQREANTTTESFSALLEAGSPLGAPPAMLATSAMTELTPELLPPLDAGMVNVTGGFDGNGQTAGYRVNPRPGEFAIAVPYDPSLLPQGFTEDDIQTYVYDRGYHRWVAIQRDSVNEAELLVCSRFRPWEKGLPHTRNDMANPQDALAQVRDMMSFAAQGEGGGDSPLDFINAVLKTPEMPETSAYTPTSIKELKAVDPLEGLTLMQPPTANNSGTANLSYPIEIPAGRQGMQPNLALTYSSGGGNGWLGVGWDISIPSITVETRWGVPRYSENWESEVYVYEGEQLVTKDNSGEFRKMAHRTNDTASISRLYGNIRFYPRKNEAFDSIVRHGNGPKDYWWSVTHKNGVTDYYGKKHGSAEVDYNSVLCDPDNHHIAQWMLTESVDPFGNWVRYSYSKEQHQSVDGGSVNYGTQLYADEISYTGHDSAEAMYHVRCNLRGEDRRDIITNGRYGFREVTASTLCNIEVWYADTVVRRYYFVTENEPKSNFKTRLTDVVRADFPLAELTSDCDNIMDSCWWSPVPFNTQNPARKDFRYALTRHNFEYFNYPRADRLYSDIVVIPYLESDNVSSAFYSGNKSATALGATRGAGWNGGGTVTVGVSNGNLLITDFNVGGNFSYGHSCTEGLITLIDLNGDGLPDKVFKKNGGVYYRPQVVNATDSLKFHFGTEVPLAGIKNFLYEESHQSSFGVQGSIFSALAASAGLPTTVSTTTTYFTDINGDGLPDLVTEDGALFNSLDDSGNPTFTEVNSLRTDPEVGVDPGQVIQTSSTAPCGGIIFDGEVDPDIDCNYLYTLDSVICGKNRDTCTEVRAILSDPEVIPIGFVDTVFYFYHSDPELIACESVVSYPDLDAVRVWVAPFAGDITISSSIRMLPGEGSDYWQSQYANGIRYAVEKNTNCWVDTNMTLHSLDSTVLIKGSLEKFDTNEVQKNYHTQVLKNDILFFRLQSKGNRSHDKTEWYASIEYDNVVGLDNYGKEKGLFLSNEDYLLTGRHLFQAPKKGTVTVSGTFSGNPLNTAVVLYITTSQFADSFELAAGSYHSIPLNKTFDIASGDSVLFEIKGRGGLYPDWSGFTCNPHLSFEEDTTDHSCSVPGTVDCYPPVRLDIRYPDNSDTAVSLRKFFGPLYRGWGQFAYRNDSLSKGFPIDVASLKLPFYLHNTPGTLDSATVAHALGSNNFVLDLSDNTTNISVETLSAAIDSIYNPLSENTRWIEMTADMERNEWVGFGNITSVGADRMSNTHPEVLIPALSNDGYPDDMTGTIAIPEYDHSVPVSVNGYPVQTIRKRNVSVMGNASLSVIGESVNEDNSTSSLSMGGSIAGGANYVISDYLDLNGDRYPDILSKKSVQYTLPWGGIGNSQTLNPEQDELCYSGTLSGGSTFSGSYPTPKREPGGNAQKGKITIDGLGGSLIQSSDNTSVMYMDINGDGLPDRVYDNGEVALNTGYGFEAKEPWNTWIPRSGNSVSASGNAGLNYSFEQISLGGGRGISQSENNTESMLMDINGDGLPDKVRQLVTCLGVCYNFGNGNWSQEEFVQNVSQISQSHSFNENGNGSLTLGIPIGCFVKIQAGGQLSPYNSSFSHDNAQLTDINGDGYPDYVTSSNEDSMTVRYSTAGKTNLLRKVTNFTGSNITLDYDMPLSCYEKPQRSWNLASVEVNDPNSPLPAARSLTRFSYADPHYNRYERMDFGYGQVTTSQYDTEGGDTLYRYTVEEFENHIFNKRGRKTRDCIYDATHKPYIEHLYDAIVYDFAGSEIPDDSCGRSDLYVGVESDLTNWYERHQTAQVTSRVVRKYDRYRNVIEYRHYGDTTHNKEFFTATIDYATGMPHNLVSLPVRIAVKDADSTLIQLRTATYTDLGKLSRLVTYSSSTDSSIYQYSHDWFGNTDTCRLPENANGQRLEFAYRYDTTVHTYPVRVDNVSLGFHSSAEYDYKIGKPTRTVDVNGNEMRYAYDWLGRCVMILAPYELESGKPYTIAMAYRPRNYARRDIFSHDTLQSFAFTWHYDPQHPGNPITTTILCDGLGRMLQTKKDAEIGGEEVSLVTGRVEYDCFGRTAAQYHPFKEDTLLRGLYTPTCDTPTRTSVRYDILDRQISIRTPLNLVTGMEYGFDTCYGRQCLRTTVTDPKGNKVKTLTGTLGQQLKQIAPMNTVTRFEYDCLGRLKKSTAPDTISTFYAYDMLGRMVRRIHPDAGTDRYHYDGAGNLTSHVNASGDSVKYRYHYNQLTDVEFPHYPANNVHYQYGTASDANINAVGKVVFQEDASGWQKFSYGKLGELTKNIRTFALPFENQTYTFAMQYKYDSWNRIQEMTYPDGERVRYGYNLGGMLSRVTGQKDDRSYHYIDSIHYNRFELKEGVWYGNGTRVTYDYDSLQRLSRLQSACADGAMQDIAYTYDSVGNIMRIENGAGTLSNGLGGVYDSRYTYDNLYRLVGADGWWNGEDMAYQMQMAYHPNGRIQRKAVRARVLTQTGTSASLQNVQYDNFYHYGNPQPNTLSSIGDSEQQFGWDASGNMTRHVRGDSERRLCWDEQNRLLGVKDNRYLSYYQYDANGDRTYKLTGKGNRQNLSGEWYYYYPLRDATLYASPYLVATRRGYTKHYYAESERIASRIGGGGLGYVLGSGDGDEELFVTHQAHFAEHFDAVMDCLGADAQPAEDLLKSLYNWLDSVQDEKDCYWYHPDHLGSSSWITFTDGKAVQHLHYLPWGEDFVNQRISGYDGARYTFSAKEKDSETGLSYFGSRYYSSDLSIWLSVDPMAGKYPSLSPYTYCADNPVKLVDPNGEEIWIPGLDEKGNVTYTAEKDDSFDSFIHQFDCRGADGKNKAREIFANARLKSDGSTVKEGTEINGEDVKKATGSDVLKGNWHNMTNSQKASQLIFAIRYSACHDDWYFDLRDFVNGFQIGGGGFNFSASNVPDGNGGFIQIHNISVGCTYDNTVMTAGLFWNEDSRANRDIFSTRNIYNNSPGHRPMIMFTLDKGNENSERFIRMVRCK